MCKYFHYLVLQGLQPCLGVTGQHSECCYENNTVFINSPFVWKYLFADLPTTNTDTLEVKKEGKILLFIPHCIGWLPLYSSQSKFYNSTCDFAEEISHLHTWRKGATWGSPWLHHQSSPNYCPSINIGAQTRGASHSRDSPHSSLNVYLLPK